jgi:hypothetical protein
MTLAQLIKSIMMTRPIAIVTGSHPALRQLGAEIYNEKAGWGKQTLTLMAENTSTTQLLTALSGSPGSITYQNFHIATHINLLSSCLENPNWKSTLIMTAPYKGPNINDKQSRHFSESNTTCCIDCPSGSDPDRVVTVAKAYGLTKEDAEFLVGWVREDAALVVEALRLLRLFPKPWNAFLIEEIIPRPNEFISFAEWHVLDRVSDESVCNQLQRRFKQCVFLSLHRKERMTLMERCKIAHVEPFLIRDFNPLVRNTRSSFWINRLAKVELAKGAAKKDLPLVREYLKLISRI